MKFKKARFWLASKILGGPIIEDTKDLLEKAHLEWMKRQLELGNEVTLEYAVSSVTPIKRRKKS